jgi:S1-C subfamily serine protease
MSAPSGTPVTSGFRMEPEEEQPHRPGDEMDDDQPGRPWLPPDDRLWRHPSEVRVNPAAPTPSQTAVLGAWARRVELRIWFLGVVSGVVGALICAVVLVATGAVGTPQTVVPFKPASTVPVHSSTSQSPPGATAVLPQVVPSVVGLSVNGAQGVVTGSGIIVSTTSQYCYVLTDSALFQEAGPNSQVEVISSSGETKAGYLVGTDPSAGLAVVRVVFLPLNSQSTPDLGSVANAQTGEEVFSVGSPFMAGSSNGSYFADGFLIDTSSYLQPVNGASDAMFSMLVADISVDNSAYGGALVDGAGDVIGITNPVTGPLARPGLTYITPIDTAMADVSSMIKLGKPAPHPWFGVLQANDVSGAGLAHVSTPAVVQVDTVASGSPAAKAGIADSDVIISVGGKGTSSVGELIAWLADSRPGQVVSVSWLHNGKLRQANITLGSQPASASPS